MSPACFQQGQVLIVNDAVAMAEELVSNHYKLSTAQWLHRKYDVKTVADLLPGEIISGPFAQVIRYEGRKANGDLNSDTFDFYKICLQDHAILDALEQYPSLELFPFTLYIITHELIHIVRFTKFLQSFVASEDERHAEEIRVHEKTHEILKPIRNPDMTDVFDFYARWRKDFDSHCGPL